MSGEKPSRDTRVTGQGSPKAQQHQRVQSNAQAKGLANVCGLTTADDTLLERGNARFQAATLPTEGASWRRVFGR